MTTEMIQKRIDSTVDRKNKKFETIDRKTKQLEKKRQLLRSAGFEDHIPQDQISSHYDLWNKTYDIEFIEEDIQRNIREIDELDKLIQKYQNQLVNNLEQENVYNNLPPILKTMKEELTRKWTDQDVKRLNSIRKQWINGELDSSTIVKKYGYRTYDSIRSVINEKEIEVENEKTAKFFVLDLYRRVIKVTGEFLDYSNLHLSGHALNGVIVGKLGKAKVETIVAGGWNIQQIHYRCLVHEIQ